MKKQLMMGLVLVMMMVFSGVGSQAWAKDWGGCMGMDGHHKGKKGGEMKFLKKLDLTPEQQTQVEAIKELSKSDKKALRKNVKNAKKELRDTVKADTFNEQAIRDASKTLSASMEEMAVFRGKRFSEIRAILTPEQIEQLAEMRAQHKGKKEGHKKYSEIAEE